jgi:RNA polymerase sigma-70 factor (ECF subfamily)
MPRVPSPSVQADPAKAEAALVERLKGGDDVAFEELVRTHGPRMYAVARRYLPEEADAQDALQDALLSAYRGIGAFAGDSRLGTWLHRVTVNAALMRIRSRSRRKDSAVDDATLEAAAARNPGARMALSASEVLSNEETRAKVRSCLSRVPEPYRAVVMLRDVEGLELKEIGRLAGIGLSAVKVRLHRGRLALRGLLAEAFPERPT